MKRIRARLHPPGIITFAVAGLVTLDVAWVFARKGNLARAKNHRWDYAALANAPEKARSKHSPLESDPETTAAGGKLFQQYCAECHGRTAEGGSRGPSLRAPEVQQATPGALFWILTNGVVRRGMPVWSKLPEPERWQLVTYLKSVDPALKPPHGRDHLIPHRHPLTAELAAKRKDPHGEVPRSLSWHRASWPSFYFCHTGRSARALRVGEPLHCRPTSRDSRRPST
jgi:mono/diheme cytochrome c family protein